MRSKAGFRIFRWFGKTNKKARTMLTIAELVEMARYEEETMMHMVREANGDQGAYEELFRANQKRYEQYERTGWYDEVEQWRNDKKNGNFWNINSTADGKNGTVA